MRIGSLFSGYGGLEEGVRSVLGGEVAWHSEIDPGACKILAHRHPDVPNLGDITTVDWSAVEPVDVLTGGFPCQDVSAAGKRLGLRPDTRSGLWTQFAYAIDQLRPPLVVVENVRGLLSADAHSDVEPCPWCVGDGDAVLLRALGAVLGDLAGLGYDTSWHGLRATDVGAPHGRFRVFVVAWPAADAGGEAFRFGSGLRQGEPVGFRWGRSDDDGVPGPAPHPEGDGRHEGRPEPARLIGGPDAALGGDDVPALCIGCGCPDEEHDARDECGRCGSVCAPPLVTDDDAAADTKVINRWPGCDDGSTEWQQGNDEPCGRLAAARAGLVEVDQLVGPELDPGLLGDGVEVGRPGAGDEVEPDRSERAADGGLDILGGSVGLAGGNDGEGSHGDHSPGPANGVNSRPETPDNWGQYGPAVRRWERCLGRPAPAPTELSAKGSPRLSPAFVEWLMGLPAGWVTDVPGLTRNEQLKALGNGVVPQQAAAALRLLLADVAVAA